ncbi:MAG: hypothetical protein AAGH70_00790 [Pseudomonadota bacterium]
MVLVAILAASLLPACGALARVAPSWIAWCPENTQAAVEERLASLDATRFALETRIARRERELALYQCNVAAPRQAVRLPEPSAPIDRNAWDARDVGLLEGCWDLDSRFSTRDTQGNQSRYQSWTMCFDGSGRGTEEMRADTGSVCRGPITGQFEQDGRLLISEPGNLQCSDGGFLFRLESRCALNDDGTASCVVLQPETNASTNVNFRRSARRQ